MQNPIIEKPEGIKEPFQEPKLRKFLKDRAQDLSPMLNIETIISKVKSGLSMKMTINSFIELVSETIAYMNLMHPDYSLLAARVIMYRLHKETSDKVEDYANTIYSFEGLKTKKTHRLLCDQTYGVFIKHAEYLNNLVDYSQDFEYDFFALKTLLRSYLLKVNGIIRERPQHMLLRVSIGIHGDNLEKIKATYQLMSKKLFTHATPTLFNSGTPKPQMSSCFLLTMTGDSITGIYETLSRCAHISKCAGGIGLSISCIRAKGSYIAGTNGNSNGIVPMLRVYDSTARYVDQGGGKRKGSFAIYIEPWHADIFEFLSLKKNHGKEELRARDLFYALWTPDLFMKRVESDGDWTLMCPNECPNLHDTWGDEFEKLYLKYESEGRGRKTIKARKLWNEIVQSQIETGTPYMLYKDACNRKSNQQNLGTIKSSNLCTEIVEYTSPDEVAVCNLASIALPRFLKEDSTYDYQRLIDVTRIIVQNLNKVIDRNYYPVEAARKSNMRHRPMGIGVQGFADLCAMLKLNYDSKEALELNNKIFETIYYAAMCETIEIAKVEGPYETFKGSPASKGVLQFDMWGVKPSMYDWDKVKADTIKHGMRNSLLLAPMPTASTSQILGNNETFEPFTSNVYTRRTLSGEYICINKHMVNDLIKKDLWTEEIRRQILANNGSLQGLPSIPQNLQKLYRTVWELPQKSLIDLAIGRGPFIDQSQSLNIFMESPQLTKISSMHFYGWKKGLKTGMYYLRSRPAVDAIKFTVDVEKLNQKNSTELKDKTNMIGKRNDLDENSKPSKNGTKRVKRKLPKMTLDQFNDEDMCIGCGS